MPLRRCEHPRNRFLRSLHDSCKPARHGPALGVPHHDGIVGLSDAGGEFAISEETSLRAKGRSRTRSWWIASGALRRIHRQVASAPSSPLAGNDGRLLGRAPTLSIRLP